MNDNAALNLIRNTFENSFDRKRFLRFAKNLLNHLDESKAFHVRGQVKDKFKRSGQVVKTYERIGTYTDPEGKKIDVLIVYLERENSIDRARNALRNFASDYLHTRGEKEAGIFAFVSPNIKDWRLSFVKMEYILGKTKSGKIRAHAQFTPAKRYSFLVGEDENSHTAQSQLAPIIQDDVNDPTIQRIESAFSVEVVTKDFFEKYKKLFLDTKEALDAMVAKDAKIKADFQEKNIETTDFAKKLLGQIVFLYFLQKKGWFGVARDDDWGTGPKDFLRRLFEKTIAPYDNFFNDTLEPLFYEALAVERTDDFYSKFNCKIPFLNGGLFDPLGNYDWVHTDIRLPDELFSNNRKTKEGDTGDGILDVFDRYNFTVKEDEPLEREVAVDPEMLGKVFENLLEVKDRKSKGTYYTPREIVHYMCQESLINYLLTELDGKVDRDDIETLIRLGETAIEHDKVVLEHGEEKGRYTFKLPSSIRNNATLIDEKLEKIHVCDPAVGSGAFLVGMMTEVIRVRNILTNYLSDNGRSIYDFKRHAIQNCLYGVDIDPGAVEIAKLRLWLSLIVDEQDIKQIKPLPNLDYKIMQGNSLLEEYEGIKLFDEGIVSASPLDNTKQIEEINQKLSDLQREFFRIHSAGELKGTKKQQIEVELKKYGDWLKKLTKAPKVKADNGSLFDQMSEAKQKADKLKKLHKDFFETANKREKDEIKKKIEVLEWELIETTLREQNKLSLLPEIERFKKANIKPFFLWKLNFSEVFEKNRGFDIVIGNPPYLSAVQDSKSESNLREVYREKYSYIKGAFDVYVVFLIRGIELLNKIGSFSWIVPNKLLVAKYAEDALSFLKENGLNAVISVSSIKVFEAGVYPILIFGNRTINKFISLEVDSLYDLQNREFKKQVGFDNKYLTFKDVGIEIASGATGFQAKALTRYLTDTPSDSTIPFIVSGSIDPYKIDFNNVRYMNKNYKKAFISKGKEIADSKWNFWRREKIIISGMTKRIEAVYFKNPLALGVGVYAIYNYAGYDPLFLLGLLNSKFMTFFIINKFKEKHLAGGYLAINKYALEKLPIVEGQLDLQEACSELVKEILNITDSEDQLLDSANKTLIREKEKQLDQLVYKLYGLTSEETELVEGKS